MSSSTQVPEETAAGKRALPPLWALSTYFAEGFPYSLVRQLSTVYFKDHGASLQAIGMTSLYGVPGVLKALWAPAVDAFSTKRRWLLGVEAVLVGAILAMALGSTLPMALEVVGVLFMLTALVYATHDIAIDGFYLEALSREEAAKYVGYQAMAYRLALIAGGGGIVAFSGLTSWPAAFLLSAGVMGALLLLHLFILPRGEQTKRPFRELLAELGKPKALVDVAAVAAAVAACWWVWRVPAVQALLAPARPVLNKIGLPGFITIALVAVVLLLLANLRSLKRRLEASDSFYAKAFVDYLDQPRIGWSLAFLMTYRTGESCLLAMVYPLLKDIGINRTQYGVIYGTFGIAASITGGILGGYLIGRFTLKRAVWPLVLAQNVPHLLYMALALLYGHLVGHPELGLANPYVVGPFVVMEAFGAGMGTSVFMVFIQRTCKAENKAAHFSIATSIMNISSTLAGILSGYLAAWMGWSLFFAFTFFVTVPSMAIIPLLPYLDGRTREHA
jgi:MFS transporter, PAT family, beta-lactamase induction signal transducer AmpG